MMTKSEQGVRIGDGLVTAGARFTGDGLVTAWEGCFGFK